MSVIVDTSKLSKLVKKALKCANGKSTDAIATLLGIKAINNTLSIYSTNGLESEVLKVSCDAEVVGSLDFCVSADTFSRLLSKTTTSKVTLSVDGNNLVFVGNGKYNLPINVVDGELLVFPEVDKDTFTSTLPQFSAELANSIILSNKCSLPENGSMYTSLNGYFITNNKAISTNRSKVSCLDINWATSSNILLNPVVLDILASNVGSVFDVEYGTENDQRKIVFKATDGSFSLVSHVLDSVMSYPVEQLSKILNSEGFTSSVKVNRKEFVDLVDRMSIFTSSEFANNGILLNISSSALRVFTKNELSNESISVIESNGVDSEVEILVSSVFLIMLLNGFDGEDITIGFGNNCPIVKLSDVGNIKALAKLVK